MVGSLPKDKRADAVRSCRRAIAVALQTGVANQIHSAGKPPALAADVSYLPSIQEEPVDGTQAESDFEDVFADNTSLPGSQAPTPGSLVAAAGG